MPEIHPACTTRCTPFLKPSLVRGLLFCAIAFGMAQGAAGATWTLTIPHEAADHAAVRIGLSDLSTVLLDLAHALEPNTDAPPDHRVILRIDEAIPSQDGYAWESADHTLALNARTPLAAAYGLCRIAWLARATGVFPPENRSESPELPYRIYSSRGVAPVSYEGPSGTPEDIARAVEAFRVDLAHAVRLGFNHVAVYGLEQVVPWEDPHYGPRAARYRAYLEAFLEEAHATGLKLLLVGDEAVYLPSDFEARGATASVKDPRFWQALQDKYRRLFAALPQLDGVVTRTGEQQPSLDFRHIDVAYHPESSPDPRIEERYATFLKHLHAVIAEEHDKLFVQRTWAVGDWAQHSVPDLYTRSFTEDLPRKNFLVSIKTTKQDQWYYGSAFNPTFGLTAHTTIVEGELHNQYHGSGQLLDYPAQWLAAAVQFARLGGVQGSYARQVNPNLAMPSAILYLWSRLAWNTNADLTEVTREWAGHTYGPQAANAIAALLLQSADAIQHGLYLRPFLVLGWNAMPLLRVREFVAHGNPLFDSGQGHDRFLRRHYLMCKPYFDETYAAAGKGAEIIEQVHAQYDSVRAQFPETAALAEFERLLDHTRHALALVRDYYRAFLSYGAYRDTPAEAQRASLENDLRALESTLVTYQEKYDHFRMDGVKLLADLARRFLADPDEAGRALDAAPTPEALRAFFQQTREEQAARLAAAGDRAQKILRWAGAVDFRILVHFQGESARHELLRGMGPGAPAAEFTRPLPEEPGVWILRPIAVPEIAHILETPSRENGYTLSVYIDNTPPGTAHFEFEIYWIPD